jgi:hypothetical protein
MTKALAKALRVFLKDGGVDGYVGFGGFETFGCTLNTTDNASDALDGPQDPGPPSLYTISGNPVATSVLTGEEPTDDCRAAAAESSSDTSDIFADLSTPVADFVRASVAHASSGSGDTIAAPTQDGDANYQLNLDGAAPTDGHNVATAVVSSAPTTSAPASWSPTAASFGSWITDTDHGYSGEALAHPSDLLQSPATAGAAAAVISNEPAATAHGPAEKASLMNPADCWSSAVANSSVGSSGATPAQVKQALDDSGLSVNGAGIKVGILSDSFNDLGDATVDEADGALPPATNVDVIKDLASGGTDEGRAMMQIVHDIAPGANLAFYTAFDSEQDFANGILALAAAGCKVIADDVSYFDEPFFQNGVVAQAIQTVEAEGVTYVSAAGNDASNGYQAAWSPIFGTYDGTRLTDAENFAGGLVQTITLTASSTETVPLLLEWNQAYGAASSDLEILVFHNGSLYGTATNVSSGEPTNPWVDFNFTASGTYQIAIENLSGPNPGLIKEITEGDGLPVTISGANAGTVYGHAMTPGVITAGAVSAAATPAFGINPAQSESFSSSGAGTELLFANNGPPLSSPDVLSPVAVSGVDDISTTVPGGLSDFYGTSAASASLAGVAALILAANPDLTPAQVEQIMEETALPISDSPVSGAGLVQIDAAVAAADSLLTKTVIQTDGSTSLVQAANNYFLYAAGGSSGPELKYSGSAVTAGEFAGWTPIGAIQTSTGYDVAWKDKGSFLVWTTDSSGNYISGTSSLSGSSTALESLEQSFHQDLNGDGTIGIVTKLIQTDGSTSLTEVANNYFLYVAGGSSGPELKYGGSAVTAGEFSGWTPVGAIRTSTGYEVAWKDGGSFLVWTTDSSGNYLSGTSSLSGTSTALESFEQSFHQDLNGDGVIGVPTTSAFSLQFKGFDYVAFYNGAYENSDSLPALAQTGANSIEATLDYGIDVATSQVVADPTYTDSLAALGNTIVQAEQLGLSVMVRPLIDFLNPSEIGPYTVGEWRQDYQPTNVAAFFASYQQMIVQEAKVAQANGAQMLSIGAELDQLAGPQFLSYWTDIIIAVRQVFTGALTYSASWNTASEVSFWSQLNYEGIDCYVPPSNAQNPSLQTLVNGWLQPATEAANPGAFAVIGNQSPIQYFENLAAQSGKPLLFTELGYANDSGAAADPSASGNSPDPTLQAELYQAFFQAWTQSKSFALVGTYFWEWDPNGSASNVGPNIDSFSPQNSSAQSAATTGFETMSGTAATQSPSAKADSAASGTGGAASQGALVKVGGPGNDAFIFHPHAPANAGSTDPVQPAEHWWDTHGQTWAFLHNALTGPSQAHHQSASDGNDWIEPSHHDGTALLHAHITDLHANGVFIH